jgi:Family of unknown function (DUF5906)
MLDDALPVNIDPVLSDFDANCRLIVDIVTSAVPYLGEREGAPAVEMGFSAPECWDKNTPQDLSKIKFDSKLDAPTQIKKTNKTTSRAKAGSDGVQEIANDEIEQRISHDLGYDVEKMNQEYALVLVGSKAVVIWEQPQARVNERVRILGIDGFKSYFAPKKTQITTNDGKIKTLNWGERWYQDKNRRTFGGLEFYPDSDQPSPHKNYMNLWRGFSIKPDAKAGTYHIFKDHLLTNVCNGDKALFTYIFAWFAQMMQRPRERVGTSLIFKGKQGTGKTKIGEVFGSLIDSHYFLVDDPQYIVGHFNAHMASCLLLQAEEAVWAGDKKAEGRLKSLVTSNIQMIEAKGIDPIRMDNYVRLIMTSNEDWVIPAGIEERRFAVFDVCDRVKRNFQYFKEMDEELNAGGREALLADLLSFDLSTIELRNIPKTDALLEQKLLSLGHVHQWWFHCLWAGAVLPAQSGWECEQVKADMCKDYLETSDRIGIKRRASEMEMGITLCKVVPHLTETRPSRKFGSENYGRVRCWNLPKLHICREYFEEILEQKVNWPKENNGLSSEQYYGEEAGKVGDF